MSNGAPIPKDLKPELHRRIDALPEEDLLFVHEVLLHAERDRLWREISSESATEEAAGSWQRLPEIISTVRARQRPMFS